MMGHILAPKPNEGIEEKLLKLQDKKLGQKYYENIKHCSII
jgi:hypothetical protein